MVCMNLGGKPEVSVITINRKRFRKNCNCCPPEWVDDGDGEDDGDKDELGESTEVFEDAEDTYHGDGAVNSLLKGDRLGFPCSSNQAKVDLVRVSG